MKTYMNSKATKSRVGATITELIVATAVLIPVATLVATLSLQIGFIWRDIDHHRLAMGELSNELDRLTRLSNEEVSSQLDQLMVSSDVANSLRQASLEGTLSEDELGIRLTLEIDWKRRYPGKPIRMVGWLGSSSEQEGADEK